MNTTARQTRKSPPPPVNEEMGVTANPEKDPATHAPSVQPVTTTCMPKQRSFVLKTLREGPASTLTFRALGICHPGSRLKELRDGGFDIPKTWIKETDLAGVSHRVALYALVSEVGGVL